MKNSVNIKSCIIINPDQDIEKARKNIVNALAKTLQRSLNPADIEHLINRMQNEKIRAK